MNSSTDTCITPREAWMLKIALSRVSERTLLGSFNWCACICSWKWSVSIIAIMKISLIVVNTGSNHSFEFMWLCGDCFTLLVKSRQTWSLVNVCGLNELLNAETQLVDIWLQHLVFVMDCKFHWTPSSLIHPSVLYSILSTGAFYSVRIKCEYEYQECQ